MKDLIIVGAGGCGRELLQWCKDINKEKETWNIKGFIDDNMSALYGYECDYDVIGKISEWKPLRNEVFALAIANPRIKEKVVCDLKGRGAVFVSVIHPQTRVSDFCKYGEGIVMYPNSSIGPNCTVGNYVTLLSSNIGHDAVVEDYATISSNCGILGGSHIGRGAFLASHVVILPKKKVGENAYVGAGSVVLRNVPKGKKVFGNPAKIVDLD